MPKFLLLAGILAGFGGASALRSSSGSLLWPVLGFALAGFFLAATFASVQFGKRLAGTETHAADQLKPSDEA